MSPPSMAPGAIPSCSQRGLAVLSEKGCVRHRPLLPHCRLAAGIKVFQAGEGAPAARIMKPAGALVLLWAALLLISGGGGHLGGFSGGSPGVLTTS